MRELTGEQHQVLNAWARYGAAYFVQKVKRGWIIPASGIGASLGNVPTVFRTKREAVAFVDNLIRIRSRQWRGLEEESR